MPSRAEPGRGAGHAGIAERQVADEGRVHGQHAQARPPRVPCLDQVGGSGAADDLVGHGRGGCSATTARSTDTVRSPTRTPATRVPSVTKPSTVAEQTTRPPCAVNDPDQASGSAWLRPTGCGPSVVESPTEGDEGRQPAPGRGGLDGRHRQPQDEGAHDRVLKVSVRTTSRRCVRGARGRSRGGRRRPGQRRAPAPVRCTETAPPVAHHGGEGPGVAGREGASWSVVAARSGRITSTLLSGCGITTAGSVVRSRSSCSATRPSWSLRTRGCSDEHGGALQESGRTPARSSSSVRVLRPRSDPPPAPGPRARPGRGRPPRPCVVPGADDHHLGSVGQVIGLSWGTGLLVMGGPGTSLGVDKSGSDHIPIERGWVEDEVEARPDPRRAGDGSAVRRCERLCSPRGGDNWAATLDTCGVVHNTGGAAIDCGFPEEETWSRFPEVGDSLLAATVTLFWSQPAPVWRRRRRWRRWQCRPDRDRQLPAADG